MWGCRAAQSSTRPVGMENGVATLGNSLEVSI